MSKDESEGKRYLEGLLKFSTDIGERQAELAYWQESARLTPAVAEEGTVLARSRELEGEIRHLTLKKLEATRMIDRMTDPVGRAILRRRYILGDTWARIAKGCGNMSQRNAHYIHDDALREFDEIFKKEQPPRGEQSAG